ncbi:MAG: hypothetical protein ACIAXF_09875 [Phycisphaerales bacterium JB063]
MSRFVTATPVPLASAAPVSRPVVLIDGVPEPGLYAVEFDAAAPLDARSARLGVSQELWSARRMLFNRPATLAVPHGLTDGASRFEVLAHGVLRMPAHRRRSGVDERVLELVDDWALRMERPIGLVWAWGSQGLEQVLDGRLGLGALANRSRDRHVVDGRAVYLLEDSGEPWTLGDAVDTLAAFADLPLDTTMLGDAFRRRRLAVTLDLTQPVGDVLRRLLGSASCMVRCERLRVGQVIRVAQAVLPASAGRRFWLPWGGSDAGGTRVSRVSLTEEVTPSRRWVLRGARPRVESTFTLVPGWDPSLAGEADAAYGRSTSSDFALYGPVFRRWVLNEDGAFSSAPYLSGAAFDLAGLFDDPRVVATPIRFERCLTRDDSGRAIEPVVEVSTDGGAAWVRYAGSASLLLDRAGVLLEDAVLPPAVLSAGQSGLLRVRVTATLRSPVALEQARWRGNPFTGAGPDRVIERGDAYRWQRVDGASIHAGAIDLGELSADEVDDRPGLLTDLLEQMSGDPGAGVSGEVVLLGAWPTVGVGDRVLDLGGAGVGAGGVPTAIEEDTAVVAGLRVRYGVEEGGPTTRLVLGVG